MPIGFLCSKKRKLLEEIQRYCTEKAHSFWTKFWWGSRHRQSRQTWSWCLTHRQKCWDLSQKMDLRLALLWESWGQGHYTACYPQDIWIGVCTVSVAEVSNNVCWLSAVWPVSKTIICLLVEVLTVLNVLTVLTINKNKLSWSQNLMLMPNCTIKDNF